MMGFVRLEEKLLCALPSPTDAQKGTKSWHLIQPNVRALLVEIHLCVLEQVFLGDAQGKWNG